jgi:hypothetical protein
VTVLTFQYLDGNGAATTTAFAAATGATWVVCTRLIQVTLTGRLRSDANVTHTLTQSVRVRNDWFRNAATVCT